MAVESYEGCLTCGQLIMHADEGSCGCDLTREVKQRVQLVRPEQLADEFDRRAKAIKGGFDDEGGEQIAYEAAAALARESAK